MRYKHIVTLVSAMLFVSSFCFGCKYTEALPMNGKNTVSSNSSKNITASNASTVSNSLGSTVKKTISLFFPHHPKSKILHPQNRRLPIFPPIPKQFLLSHQPQQITVLQTLRINIFPESF